MSTRKLKKLEEELHNSFVPTVIPANLPETHPDRTEAVSRKRLKRIVRPFGELTEGQKDALDYNYGIVSVLLDRARFGGITPIQEPELVIVDERTLGQMYAIASQWQTLPRFSSGDEFPPPSCREPTTGEILRGTRIAPYYGDLFAVCLDARYDERCSDARVIREYGTETPEGVTKLPQPGVPLVAFQSPDSYRRGPKLPLVSPVLLRPVGEIALGGMHCVYAQPAQDAVRPARQP